MNKHIYWLISFLPAILLAVHFLLVYNGIYLNLITIGSLILIVAFAFSFYKIIKDEKIEKSIIYYFSFGVITGLFSFITALILLKIEKSTFDMGGLIIIIFPVYVMLYFFGAGLVVLIFKELNKKFKKK